MSGPLVLGIETSCDETGAGLVRGRDLLADALASSVEEHARFGGVVPEVASRAHLEAIVPTVHRALAEAGVTMRDIDAIAVTAGPGLAGALLVGVAAAKSYAVALGKPLYAANHLAAHVAVDRLAHGDLPQPCIALLVSGGQSSLLLVADVAASFQEAVVDVLTARAVRACRDHDVDHLVIGGGVAANSRLRAVAESRCADAGITLRVPPPKLCTDNGAMVAALGVLLVE